MIEDPFASARAKLGRAREHRDSLQWELDGWVQAQGQSWRAYLDTDGPWHILYAPPFPRPPDALLLIAGDMVTSARATLDHCVVGLVRKGGKSPTRSNRYPICNTEQDWCSAVVSPRDPKRGALWGLDPKGQAWAIIRSTQPYLSPEPMSHFITIISALANHDKHDSLIVQAPFPSDSDIEGIVRWNSDILLERIVADLRPLSFDERTELLRLRFDPTAPDPAVNVKGRLTVYPTFGDGVHQGGPGMFDTILNRIAEVIEQLAASK